MAIRLEDHKRMEYLDGLIVSVQGGDRDALGTLYHETSAGVYSFALSILKNVHDAQDVLQDCYISVFQSANQYRSGTKPMAWIMTIARNFAATLSKDPEKMAQLYARSPGLSKEFIDEI